MYSYGFLKASIWILGFAKSSQRAYYLSVTNLKPARSQVRILLEIESRVSLPENIFIYFYGRFQTFYFSLFFIFRIGAYKLIAVFLVIEIRLLKSKNIFIDFHKDFHSNLLC